ncbi:MAG: hypothetical protein ACYC6T_08125 [Thermoleophilia bacterium]
MSDTCKGCRYYEAQHRGGYSYREVRHLCWVEPTVIERRRSESSEPPPACSRWEGPPEVKS